MSLVWITKTETSGGGCSSSSRLLLLRRNSDYNFLALHGLIMYWSLFSISTNAAFCASELTATILAPHVADA